MKYKNTRLIILISTYFAIGLVSCTKNNSQNPPPAFGCKVASITNTGYQPTYITYRADGKIDKMTYDDELRTFSYNGNSLTVLTTKGGAFDDRKTITLNANGMPVNVRGDYNETGTEWYNDAFEYNGREVSKQVLSDSYSSNSDIITYTWANGNLVKQQSPAYGTTVYEYFLNKNYSEGDFFYIDQFLYDSYQFVFNKNILKSSKTGNYPIDLFYYTYDADGNINSFKEDNSNPTTLAYKCN